MSITGVLSYPFVYYDPTISTVSVEAPLTITVTTDRTVFNYTFTQTADPFNFGRAQTAEARVTLNESSTLPASSGISVTPGTTTSASSSGAPAMTSSTFGSASTSAASTSGSTSPAVAASKGLSSGAAAGIGIGCAIAGAAIAGLLVCLLMRRRGRRHVARPPSRGASMRAKTDSSMSYPGYTMSTMAKSGPMTTVERSLEPPLEDNDILGSMQRLGAAIKNHVQSYYPAGGSALAGGPNVSTERLATLLGSNAPVQPQQLASMLTNPQSRTAAARFLIAWSLLRDTHGGPAEVSLLPPELAECLEVMKPGRLNGNDAPLMLSHWRQLTATLMRSTYGSDNIAPSDPRQHNVRDLVEKLNGVLALLASSNRGSEQDRLENLEEIVKRAARYLYTLFTQPTQWDFSWDGATRQQGDLVVFPGLSRTTDEKGTRLAQPQAQGAPQVVNVGSARASSR